jgi:predicted cobalt transporter CbtA
MTFPDSLHRWLVLAEHGALRVLMVAIGLLLMVVGLGLGVSMVMLPPGIFFGLTGFALLVWGAVGELPAAP